MTTRITSATVLVNWDSKIHTHALLVYGPHPSQSKNYEEYAKKVSSKQWSLDSAVMGFWGKGGRVPLEVYKYFQRNPVTNKPKGFENGIKVQFEFGVAKLFDTGKGLLTVSLKGVAREFIMDTLESYVKVVHEYIKNVAEHDDLQWVATQLNVEHYKWEIVSLNSTSVLFDKAIELNDLYAFCNTHHITCFYDAEYHKGYLQMYFHCKHKKNTVCVYHTGKCCIMGIKSLESLVHIETELQSVRSKYEDSQMSQIAEILFDGLDEEFVGPEENDEEWHTWDDE